MDILRINLTICESAFNVWIIAAKDADISILLSDNTALTFSLATCFSLE
jgi:hypothetical protein